MNIQLWYLVALAGLGTPVLAQTESVAAEVAAFVDEVPADPALVARYMTHVTFLGSPFLGGRLPGTEGMEIAKDYMQYYLAQAGLQPGAEGPEGPTWRQPFALAGRHELQRVGLTLADGTELEAREDFSVPGWGGFGRVEGPVVFVGYAVESGPEGYDYQGFPEAVDLTGKVALMLRFEPMNAEGRSAFGARRWSSAAGFEDKFRALTQRGASAVLVVNTPGADDSRTKRLSHEVSWSNNLTEQPVLLVSPETANRILAQAGQATTIEALTQEANEHGVVRDLGTRLTVDCEGESRGVMAENVLGVLPGKGTLANEVVIIGAHLDHLGMGGFGSRDNELRGKAVHPGADDNATGCSALILLAESLGAAYADMPDETPARTILFAAFSAEESGLNGARHYTREPVYPLDQTSLMINFDMIGRIEKRRLSASCLSTGDGLQAFVEGLATRTPLTLVADAGVQPASDHWTFVQAKVPSVFMSMDGIHNDYHTTRDTVDRIQPEDALWATLWVHELALEAALRPEKFPFVEPQMQARRAPAGPTVRLGVSVAAAPDTQGVVFSNIVEASSAARAGLQEGDVLVRWQGEAVTGLEAWRTSLMKLKPGDEVTLTVMRDGHAIECKTTMDAAR